MSRVAVHSCLSTHHTFTRPALLLVTSCPPPNQSSLSTWSHGPPMSSHITAAPTLTQFIAQSLIVATALPESSGLNLTHHTPMERHQSTVIRSRSVLHSLASLSWLSDHHEKQLISFSWTLLTSVLMLIIQTLASLSLPPLAMLEESPGQVSRHSTVSVSPVANTQFQVLLLYSLMAG